jgi:nucleoid-associated protein YgaU
MGNLEKLGILVIVILVVVVGVVAITPKESVDQALFPEGEQPVPAPIDPSTPQGAVADGANPQKWPTAMDPAAQGAPQAPLGVDPSALAQSATQGTGAPGQAQIAPVAPPAPAVAEYVVQKGDTGERIAKKTGVAWSKIAAANGNVDARKLKIGQKLVLPAAAAETPVAQIPTVGGTAATPPMVPGTTQQPGTQLPSAPQPSTQLPLAPDAVTPAPAPAAEGRTYVVQGGDTLSDIARRELGSASKWRLIQEANADVLKGSEVLRKGMKLRIPAISRTASTASSGASTPAAQSPASPGAKTYKVQRGDSLSSIASRLLGSSSRWKEILKANESVLHGSTSLREGMELSIPDDVSAR